MKNREITATETTRSTFKHDRISRSVGQISAGTLVSRFLGVGRDISKAYMFGTGTAADAFTVAFRIPNLFRAFFAEGTLSAAFIPVFSDYLAANDREGAREAAAAVVTALLVVVTALTVVGVLLAPWLVKFMAYGFRDVPGKIPLTIDLTRLTFVYLVFVAMAAVYMGILNSLRHFWTPSIAPALLNLCLIASIFLLCPRLGSTPEDRVYGLAMGAVFGGVAQSTIMIPVLRRKGMLPTLRLCFSHPAVRKVARLMVPGLVGLGVVQINAVVDTYLGALLREGSVAALEYGNRLMQLPLGVFGAAMGTAVLPVLSIQAARNNVEELRSTLTYSLRMIAFIMIPATLGLIALRTPIIHLLFTRGEFSAASSLPMTASALLFYSSGLISYGSVKCVVPVFYSMKDTRTPVATAIVAMVSNVILNLILMRYLQLGGIALATALSSAINLALLMLLLRRRIGSFVDTGFLRSLLKTVACAVIMMAVCWSVSRLLELSLDTTHLYVRCIQVGGAVMAGLVTFVGCCMLLKSDELRHARGMVPFGRKQ